MEARNTFLKTLDKVRKSLRKMTEQEAAVRWYCDAGDMNEAYEHAMRLEETSERTVLLTRILPVYTGNPIAYQDVENITALCIPTEIGYTPENWFSVRIPALLPKKEAGSPEYIRSFLYPAMGAFFKDKEPIRFRDCVLIFRHVYDRKRPERSWRDHDNIELNAVSDVIAMYTMPDDNPKVCSHYYCSAAGAADRTEVYVVPRSEFPMWLVTERAMPDEGVMLHEKLL